MQFYLVTVPKLFDFNFWIHYNFVVCIYIYILSTKLNSYLGGGIDGRICLVPGAQGRLVVVSEGKVDVVAYLERNGGSVGISEPFCQCPRRYLRRRSPAAGGYQFVRRRHDRTAKYAQHIWPDLRNSKFSFVILK